MKKALTIIVIALFILVTVTGCSNRQLIDITNRFDRAIISLPNGEVVDGKVDSWLDFENGDQIQVKIDGVTYLIHSTNVALIHE